MSYSLTYRDVIDGIRSWLGGNATRNAHLGIIQPVKSALREITGYRKWNYLMTQGRIYLHGVFSDGTIAYDLASNVMTLTGGVWPTWAEDSDVRIGDVLHRVALRLTDTTLQMYSPLTPEGDVASGTSYQMTKRIFTLPEDFAQTDVQLLQFNLWNLGYVPPRDWLIGQRYISSTGPPDKFTVLGHPRLLNRLALMIEPASGQDDSLDFVYYRKPRELVITGYEADHYAGTVSGSASYTITGVGTAFDAAMIGSLIRVSGTSNTPGQNTGPIPYIYEARITAVASATSITVDSDSVTFSGKAYVVSDPVDIDPVMTDAYLRCCEKQTGIHRRTKNVKELDALFNDALHRAEAADSKVFVPRVIGVGGSFSRSLSNYPAGDDQS